MFYSSRRGFRDPQTPLTPEQSEMRKRVLKQIENDPEKFDMGDWSINKYDGNSCLTTHCLAGWAEVFAFGSIYDRTPSFNHERIGIDLFGLTEREYYGDSMGNTESLFYDNNESALERMRKLAHEE